MPIIWMETMAAETGVIGAAMAHLDELEAEVQSFLLSAGMTIIGGIAYFFGPAPFAPPMLPSCTAIPGSWLGGYTGGADDDVIDLDWTDYVDLGDGGGDEPPPV